eukprot:2312871-Lingulodinium_polyedra.AAC.1
MRPSTRRPIKGDPEPMFSLEWDSFVFIRCKVMYSSRTAVLKVARDVNVKGTKLSGEQLFRDIQS